MIRNIGTPFPRVSISEGHTRIQFIFFFLGILAAKNLIDHLIVVDCQKRMRANEILLHPWIMSTGQSKSLRNVEELKSTLRGKYEAKMKEYAMENDAP